MTKALANMNPNRPIVDLPLFIFELKDFPHMLKQAGDVLKRLPGKLRLRDVPEAHLAYSFGWAPLVSDLWSLVKLAKSIEERKAYFRSLEYGARVKRTLFKGELSRTTTPDGYQVHWIQSPDFISDIENVETLKVWFTANARWIDPLSDARQDHEYTVLDALGANLSAETLWNAIPWSWLIDYFANVGDVLAARRGYNSWQCTRMCLMARTEVESTLTRVRLATGLSADVGSLKTTVKQRSVYTNPTPILTYDPFLSGRQLAILGSLITARSFRKLAR